MVRNLEAVDAPQSANPVLEALQNQNLGDLETKLTEILAALRDEKAVTLLFDSLLKSPSSESRRHIVKALAAIGSDRAVEVLGSVMQHDFDPEIKQVAVKALANVGSEKAIDILLTELRNSQTYSYLEVAQELARFTSEKVVDALLDAAKNGVVAAVSSLRYIGTERAIQSLVSVAVEIRPGSDMANYYALQDLIWLDTDTAIDGLFEAWVSKNELIRDRLFFMMYQFKPPKLIIPLCRRLQDDELPSETRKTAAQILGIIGTEKEIPLLKSIWSENYEEVGWAAHRAAEQIALVEFEKRAERERALEETRSFIVHEFRHALAPLNAFVKLLHDELARDVLNKEKLESLVRRIRTQTNLTFELVDQYLDYSRPLAPTFRAVDIDALVQQSFAEFDPEFKDLQIKVIYNLHAQTKAEVDAQMLTQAMRNIVINAIHAIESNGEILVATSNTGRQIAIEVRDTGSGIKPEDLPRVFDIGFTTKPGKRGAGIGLALTKRFVEEAHHGSIQISNNAAGSGVTVTITVPTVQMEILNGRSDLAPADR
jgi:signal transduction histidine kinase